MTDESEKPFLGFIDLSWRLGPKCEWVTQEAGQATCLDLARGFTVFATTVVLTLYVSWGPPIRWYWSAKWRHNRSPLGVSVWECLICGVLTDYGCANAPDVCELCNSEMKERS